MRFYARHERGNFFGLILLASLLAAVGAAPPVRAEFFFPFFDNRPSTPPRAQPLPQRHRRTDGGVLDLRGKTRTHHAKPRPKDIAPVKPAESPNKQQNAAAPVEEGPPPPYEPKLLRLSEIMGALSYLQSICTESPATKAKVQAQDQKLEQDQLWRGRMQDLMSAEAAGPGRREKLAGAYNRGLQGYEYSYRVCTPSAKLARQRFLDEGARLAHDITTQYRAN
jgi:uncharacterized protein (TIGR02301 family)